MQTLVEKAGIVLNTAWKSIDSNPKYSFMCTDWVIQWYYNSLKDNYLLTEELKPLYEEALKLRDNIQLPKTDLESII